MFPGCSPWAILEQASSGIGATGTTQCLFVFTSRPLTGPTTNSARRTARERMSGHHTSPLRPENEDLLQVSSRSTVLRSTPIRCQFPHNRRRSPTHSPSLPISLASLPPLSQHPLLLLLLLRLLRRPKVLPQKNKQQPQPRAVVVVAPHPIHRCHRRRRRPSRPQNKRPGRPTTKSKSPNGADRARTCAHAPRRSGRGGRSAVRVSARSRRSACIFGSGRTSRARTRA